MRSFPTSIDDLKRVVQELWDEMDPTTFIKDIEVMPEKLEAIINAQGLQTKFLEVIELKFTYKLSINLSLSVVYSS